MSDACWEAGRSRPKLPGHREKHDPQNSRISRPRFDEHYADPSACPDHQLKLKRGPLLTLTYSQTRTEVDNIMRNVELLIRGQKRALTVLVQLGVHGSFSFGDGLDHSSVLSAHLPHSCEARDKTVARLPDAPSRH